MEHRDSTSERGIDVVMIGPVLAGQASTLEWLSRHGGSAPPRNRRLAGYDYLSVALRPSALLAELPELPLTYWWKTTASLHEPGKERALFRLGHAFLFVVDSQELRLVANLEFLDRFREILAIRLAELEQLVGVVLYTKRDTPTALPLSELSEQVNPMGWPEFEAHPAQGTGVRKPVTKLLRLLQRNRQPSAPA